MICDEVMIEIQNILAFVKVLYITQIAALDLRLYVNGLALELPSSSIRWLDADAPLIRPHISNSSHHFFFPPFTLISDCVRVNVRPLCALVEIP